MRSVALHSYLIQVGVLNGTPAEIAMAKCAYRKQYKQDWKLHRHPTKEIRYTVTIEQYKAIQSKAHHVSLQPTTYAKNVILESIGEPISPAPLLDILQLLGMAVIAFEHNATSCRMQELVSMAETKLLQYLQV